MSASVQDLLAAANARSKSPFISMMEGLTTGLNEGMVKGPGLRHTELENQKLQMDMQMEQDAAARAQEQSDQLMARLRGDTEARTQNTLNKTAPGTTPATPALRLKGLQTDKYGFLQGKYEEPNSKSLKPETYFDPLTKKNRIAVFDPETGQWRKGPNDPLAPESQGSSRTDTSLGLMKVFIDRPEVKEHVAIQSKVGEMDALYNAAMSGSNESKLALDQGLITLYNKITDPNSVVRESEYARTPENLSWYNRFQGAMQKVTSGGAGLTDDDRTTLLQGAKVIANQTGKNFQARRNEYNKLAVKKGLDPELITGTVPDFQPYDVNANGPAPLKPVPVTLPTGKKVNIVKNAR